MTDEKVISLLTEIVRSGTPISVIEGMVGMPRNNLSGMLSGGRKFMQKWKEPLEEYINLAGKKKVVLVMDDDGRYYCDGKFCSLVWEVEEDKKEETLDDVKEVEEAKEESSLTGKQIADIENQIKEWERRKCPSYIPSVKQFENMRFNAIEELKNKLNDNN